MKKILILYFIILTLWTLVRFFVPINNGLEEVIIKPIIFFTPLFFILKSEQKTHSIQEVGEEVGLKKEHFFKSIFIGVVAVILLILYNELITHFLKGQSSRFQHMDFTSPIFFWNIVVSFFTAFCEEVIFRGYVFQKLMKLNKGIYFSTAVSTTAFVLLHLPRIVFVLHFSPSELFVYLDLLLCLSVVNTVVFWKSKNLSSAITTHMIWNFYSSF